MISLKIDRGQPPDWVLDLRGRWVRDADDTLRARVAGTLRGPERADPAAGTVTLWPFRLPGGVVIGASRIALDVTAAAARLVLDGQPGPPPYLLGITLSGRLADPAGDQDVKIWINPAQLVELWLRLTL